MVDRELKDVVLFFEVHQPYRLDRRMREKLVEKAVRGSLEPEHLEEVMFDEGLNRLVIERASKKCYIPATTIVAENVRKFALEDRKFTASFGISAVFIEQALRWVPRVVELFQDLVSTELVELVAQTYYHSLASLIPPHYRELREQVEEHVKLVENVFGVKPVTAENTEFIYNNDIACELYSMGFKVVLAEGVDQVLGWRTPNFVYSGYFCDVRVLLRNYRLSDDVGFRFSNRVWDQYPLTADKYAAWLAATPGDVIFLAMDYETFGEHHWPETGIHEFLKYLPQEVLKHKNLRFSTPSKAAFDHKPVDKYDVPSWRTISWADERDLGAWIGNSMQRSAFEELVKLKNYVDALEDPSMTRLWKLLTISDHFYYMATKFGSFGEVHQYFSPYKNAVDAHSLFMQAVSLLSYLVAEKTADKPLKVLKNLVLPPGREFHFRCFEGGPSIASAASIREFIKILEEVPLECVVYHLNRGDIQRWIRDVYALEELAAAIDELAKAEAFASEKKTLILRAIQSFFNS